MERDLGFVVGWLLLVAFIAGGLWLWRRRIRQDEEHALEATKLREQKNRKAHLAGTHTEEGVPYCRVDGCRLPAVGKAVNVVRDPSIMGYLRERVGAPARYRCVADGKQELAYCRFHTEVAPAETGVFLVKIEQRRLERVRDDEIEIARFVARGLDERLSSQVAAHEARFVSEAPPTARVVSIGR